MKIINKLKSNNGSALVLAIILMLLVSMVAIMFSSQIANVVNRTSKNYEDLKIKYALEAGIEKAIGEISTNIQNQYKNGRWRENYIIVSKVDDGYNYIEKRKCQIEHVAQNIFSSSSLGYFTNEIDINMNINMDRYEKNKNFEQYIITGVDISDQTSNNEIIDIIVSKNYKGKIYTLKASLKFKITDLNTGEVKYTINSWEQIN